MKIVLVKLITMCQEATSQKLILQTLPCVCACKSVPGLRQMRTIFETQDDLRGSVETGDQVGRELVVPTQHGAAKVAQLHDVALLVHQYVVGLDVRMQHAAVLQVMQRHEHLLGVHTDPIQVQAHTRPVLLGQLPQVDVL